MYEQNTNEWLEWRRSKIGASDAPIIMGESPWKTPYQLWRVKVGLDNYDGDNFAMQRGRDLEDQARAAYEEKTGRSMFAQVLTSKKHDFLAASFDGLTLDGKYAVEIKCPGEKDHLLAQKGVIPDKYIYQLQHQMFVGELAYVDYWSYDGENGCLVRCMRNESFIERMLEKELAFYENMVRKEPPPLSERDYVERDDGKWLEKEKAWADAHAVLKEAQEAEKQAREELLNCTDSNARGQLVQVTKYLSRGRVNYSRIPELIGVDLDGYRGKDSECWRISARKGV